MSTIHCLPCEPRRFPHSPKRQRGDGFTGPTVPALTLGAMRGQLTGQSKKLKAVELGNAQKAQVGHGTDICQQINGIFLQLIFLTNGSYWFTSRSARHHKNDERLAGQGGSQSWLSGWA